jgi:hypothetical protein
MSLHVAAAAVLSFAGVLPPGHQQSGLDAVAGSDILMWLGPLSLAAVVAMVLLELGKSLPPQRRFRRLADRVTRPLVAVALIVVLASGYRLAEIIGFVQ